MKAALLQITSSDDPSANADLVSIAIREAAANGAGFVLTPEVTNIVSMDRTHQSNVLNLEKDDPFLARMQREAKDAGVWLALGSLALKTGDPDGRFANRSFVIDPDGEIKARYDKIHMFDAEVSETEAYRESSGYRPGDRAEVIQTTFGALGLSVCYDIRFPYLYRALAQAGAEILLVPAAFSPQTGRAHWETLLRARAIETGCYVLAAAQTGTHPTTIGKVRSTYGHTMAISPWGEVIADLGEPCGTLFVDLDLAEVANARKRIPSLKHDRSFIIPNE